MSTKLFYIRILEAEKRERDLHRILQYGVAMCIDVAGLFLLHFYFGHHVAIVAALSD